MRSTSASLFFFFFFFFFFFVFALLVFRVPLIVQLRVAYPEVATDAIPVSPDLLGRARRWWARGRIVSYGRERKRSYRG